MKCIHKAVLVFLNFSLNNLVELVFLMNSCLASKSSEEIVEEGGISVLAQKGTKYSSKPE